MRTHRATAGLLALLLSLTSVVGTSCRRQPPDVPLPSEDDLYAYCQAVSRRAQILAPGEAALSLFGAAKVEQRFGYEDRALEMFAEVSRLAPSFVDPWVETGFILSQRNERHPEAVEAYERAIQIDPRCPGVKSRLGLIFLHQNRLEEAERVLTQETADATGDENTTYTLAQVLALANRHEDAVKQFRSSLDDDPENRMAWYGLSNSLLALGKKEEAEAALAKFRELKKREDDARADPTLGSSNRSDQLKWTGETWLDAAVLFWSARAREADRDRRAWLEREYVRSLRESIRFYPANSHAQHLLVRHLEEMRNLEGALEQVRQALDVAPSRDLVLAAFRLVVGDLEGRSPRAAPAADRRVDRAVGIFQRIAAVAPDFAPGHLELCRLILRFRNADRDLVRAARSHAETAVRLDPIAAAYDNLAFARVMDGDLEGAAETLAEGLRKFPDDPDLKLRLERFRARYPQAAAGNP